MMAGSTKIGRGFMTGGNSVVSAHLTLADNVHLAGRSTVTNNVTRPGAYGGYPLQRLPDALKTALLRKLRIAAKDLSNFAVFKRGVDARKKSAIVYSYIVDAEIAERQAEFVAHLLVHDGRYDDRARRRQRLQAGRDIHRVTEHVVIGIDDVAEMQADAEGLPPLDRHVGVALGHAALQLDCRAHRLDGAAELGHHAVTDGLDDAAVVALEHRRDQLGEMGAQIGERLLLVGAHHAAVARHVGEQDGGKAAIAAGAGVRHLASVT